MILAKRNIGKRIKAQRATEGQMLNVTLKDEKRNRWKQETTKLKRLRERTARPASHIYRQTDYRCTVRDLDWRPCLGGRARGRPQMRLLDDLQRHNGLA